MEFIAKVGCSINDLYYVVTPCSISIFITNSFLQFGMRSGLGLAQG